jgi:hypothetical protein
MVSTTFWFNKTRFECKETKQALLYRRIDNNTWSFFNHVFGTEPSKVGPVYKTQAELLADAERFATQYGY